MKPLLVLFGLVLAAGAGAAGGALFAPASAPSAAVTPAPAALAAPAGIPAEFRQQVDSLHMEIANLESKVRELESQRDRAPAVATSEKPERVVVADSPEVFAALHREAILKVLADERADQEKKREEERAQREQQQLAQRAERVATKFNLNETQKRQLTDFYGLERQKQDEMRNQFREQGPDPASENPVRDAFREFQSWRSTELTRLFGTDLGGQINDSETDRFRGLAGGRRGQGGANGGTGAAGAPGGAPGRGGQGR